MDSKKVQRFTKLPQVRASYHDIVCNFGLDTESCVQTFWYECNNENLSEDVIKEAFQSLIEAKKISSPYLMNILDVSHSIKPPRFIVITEATDSPSLFMYTKQLVTHPPDKTIIKWFKNLATAVQALHNSPLKVIHGNISLQNVFFRTTPINLKLTLPIMTLSKRAVSKQSIDIDPYTAPERLKGTISKANDIWSLGICFLELLTRKSAYEEIKTPIELIDALSDHRLPESLSEVKNPAAVELIKKCLQPELFRINIDELLADPVFVEAAASQTNPSEANSDPNLLV